MEVKKLRDIEKDLNKKLGEDIMLPLTGSFSSVKDGLSSGSLSINTALSGNPFIGYAWGRIVEIYGPEASGKTTLALHAIRECQKLDFPCAYVDAEHALDMTYSRNIGVDVGGMSFCQPSYGEQALTVVGELLKSDYRLIVVDSVAALVPKSELEGEIGDAHMGRQARMMGQAMRMLSGRIAKSKAIVIYINQTRAKLGLVFGNPETTTGGNALKFYASYRIDIRSPRGGAKKEKSIDEETTEVGIVANVKVVKNKLFPPYRTASVYIQYGVGIHKERDILDYLVNNGLFIGTKLKVLGGSYTKDALVKALEKDSKIRSAVMKIIKGGGE